MSSSSRRAPLRWLSFLLAIYLAASQITPTHKSPSEAQSNSIVRKVVAPFKTLKRRAISWLPSLLLRRQSDSLAVKRLDNQLSARDVTVQLFQWSHLDVAKECEQFLGPAGYRYVQISPSYEHIAGPQWWSDYQPVSYRIGSKRGSQAQFEEMVQRCGKAGVGVIADIVINHMSAGSPTESRQGVLGSSYKKYDYPNIYSANDFHYCGRNEKNEIRNYSDRYEVQNCELVGLADLDTGKDKVQRQLSAALSGLVSKGVLGFRLDAAKHIAATQLQKIVADVPVRIVQEVIYGAGEPIRPEEYMPTGRVHIFQATYDLKRMFLTDGIAYLGKPIPWGEKWGDGYLPSSHSQVFVTNWDTERTQTSLRIDQTPAVYLLCQTFLLTWDYGQVDVFSGYNFTGYDDGPARAAVECDRYGWRCEHRHPVITGAIRLRSAAAGQPVQNIITSGNQRLAFNRGSKVFVALNNDDTAWALEGIVVGLAAPPPNKPYKNLLVSTGVGENVDVHVDQVTGRVLWGAVSVPARSALGIMAA